MASHDFCYGCPACREEARVDGIHARMEKLLDVIKKLEPFAAESVHVDLTIALLQRKVAEIGKEL